jgi:outer membrane protein insertion porin family
MKILLLLICFFVNLAQAYELSNVNLKCTGSELCVEKKSQFLRLIGYYRSETHLRNTIKILASEGGYDYFEYEILRNDTILELNLNISVKPKIKSFEVIYLESKNFPDLPVGLHADDIHDQTKMIEEIFKLKQLLVGKGYPNVVIEPEEKFSDDDQVDLTLLVKLNKPISISNFKIRAQSVVLQDYLKGKLIELENKPMDMQLFRSKLDETKRYLFDFGYYLLQLDYEIIKKNANSVIVAITASQEDLFVFEMKGNERVERAEILREMKELLKKFKKTLTDNSIIGVLKELYKKYSYKQPDIKIKRQSYKNKFEEEVTRFNLLINEGPRTKLANVLFSGNEFFSEDKLQELFESQSFELTSLGYLDEAYYAYFSEWLKNQYITNGFLRVKVNEPVIDFSTNQQKVNVEYNISEGSRVFVNSINFENLPTDLSDSLLTKIQTQVASPFNPFVFTEDLKLITKTLTDMGYYFAEISNIGNDDIVVYPKDKTQVDINIKMNLGSRIKLNRTIILGNVHTKTRIIERKSIISPGDYITPDAVQEMESRISSTGLFSSVDVYPAKHLSSQAETDLIIKVKERDYGLVEVAPGYRTDIGLKLSGTYSYLNIGGLNRGITFRGQINQRLNYQTLDKTRRDQHKSLLEYNISTNYTQSDIFDSYIDWNAGLTYQRKRFYAFDADILRLSNTISKDLSKIYSVSLRHQFETIKQFEATEIRDNGAFRIGAITPSLTADFRNSIINTTKGSFFNLSCEFANPYFLSQDNSDLVVNYYKLVSRNRFYLPYKNGTLAVSFIGGVQENLAKATKNNADGSPVISDGQHITEGYIPSIKVFRLTGMDIVRGYSDEEINRMINGKDIGDERIQNKAYLANLKIEPRYFVNDAFITGLFYDAGRVYVDQVNLGELRSSVGVSFKILTPVGTLDFDYGIKTLRKRNSDGTLETPGRFHVSIGFF